MASALAFEFEAGGAHAASAAGANAVEDAGEHVVGGLGGGRICVWHGDLLLLLGHLYGQSSRGFFVGRL